MIIKNNPVLLVVVPSSSQATPASEICHTTNKMYSDENMNYIKI